MKKNIVWELYIYVLTNPISKRNIYIYIYIFIYLFIWVLVFNVFKKYTKWYYSRYKNYSTNYLRKVKTKSLNTWLDTSLFVEFREQWTINFVFSLWWLDLSRDSCFRVPERRTYNKSYCDICARRVLNQVATSSWKHELKTFAKLQQLKGLLCY